MRRAVVIGLDGAAWHLLDPMIERGLMPRLAALRAQGASGPIKSTIPTYTPPAWTSAATGVNPGRHGIYGFHVGNAQDVPQKLVHSGRIKSPTIWEIVNDQGGRAGIYNLPLTYPPRDVDGWMVSGMMTPGYGQHLKGFVRPERLEERILSWAPDYVVEIKTSWEQDWRDESLCLRALESIEQRHRVLTGLLQDEPCDLVFTVIETPDRLQHAYYRYMDPNDEMYSSNDAARIRPFLDRCFAAIDGIVGLLADYAGREGGVIVCSDHGFTAWDVSVHTNALLEKWGYLKIKPSARAMQTSLVRRSVPIAKRLLPVRFARRAKGRTFAAIDWAKTKAFASPIPMQGIFVNLEGRERMGVVKPSELNALKDELTGCFESLRGPDGELVTDHVWRSEEVFTGPAQEEAPDLIPVLRDHRFELDDEVFHRDPFHEVAHLPRGVHHPHGMGIMTGPGVKAGAAISGSIMDITPTLLYMAGLKVPEGLDGSVLLSGFAPVHAARHPVDYTDSVDAKGTTESSPYSEEEEALIEDSLRGLGYL